MHPGRQPDLQFGPGLAAAEWLRIYIRSNQADVPSVTEHANFLPERVWHEYCRPLTPSGSAQPQRDVDVLRPDAPNVHR